MMRRDEIMRNDGASSQVEASVVLTQSDTPDPQSWNPPTLTTWKIEDETLGSYASGADGMAYGRPV
jgi:hypothetical protein